MQRLLRTAVLDQTVLTGEYNFHVEFERGEDPFDYTAVVLALYTDEMHFLDAIHIGEPLFLAAGRPL